MDHIYRQRELLKFIGLETPGKVLKVHYTNLGFGNESKPFHFSVNIIESGTALETVFLVPVTSKLYQKRHLVKLNLAKNSNLGETEEEYLDIESYALVARTRQVKAGKLFEPPASSVRGSLDRKKCSEILAARKKYINEQFRNNRKGDSE